MGASLTGVPAFDDDADDEDDDDVFPLSCEPRLGTAGRAGVAASGKSVGGTTASADPGTAWGTPFTQALPDSARGS